MEREIFDFTDYREFLLYWIASRPKRGRGMRVILAQNLRCPLSHISQVMKGISNLTAEQAEDLNEYLGHTTDQAEYFLLLVQLARAGSFKLEQRIRSQVEKIRETRLILNKRLEVKATVSQEDQALFYSSWHYAAIHILLTIDAYQTKEAVAKYLDLSLKRASEALDFLVRTGLVTHDRGRFTVGTTRVHLGSDSPMISKHHINWRLRVIRSLEDEESSDPLHYSSVASIAKKDVTKIKAILVKAIESSKELIRDSQEEELHSFCMDFFKV